MADLVWRHQDKNPALVESHYFGGPDLQLVNGLGSAMSGRVYEVQCHIKLLRWKTSTLAPTYRDLSETWVCLLAERIAGEETPSEFTSVQCTVAFLVRGDPRREEERAAAVSPWGRWVPADGAAAPGASRGRTALPGALRSAYQPSPRINKASRTAVRATRCYLGDSSERTRLA